MRINNNNNNNNINTHRYSFVEYMAKSRVRRHGSLYASHNFLTRRVKNRKIGISPYPF